MLRDLMDVFSDMYKEKGDKLIINEYVPKNGTYILILIQENGFHVEKILNIGKNHNIDDYDYNYIAHLDYYSKLISMQKPIDKKKIIHSNNYLSFAIKEENIKHKLTPQIIEDYYAVLLNPPKKNKTPNNYALYRKVDSEIGRVDKALLNRIKSIMLENEIWNCIDINDSGKDYIKFYFVLGDIKKTISLYQKEYWRYLIPHIYNNNDFNIMDGKEIVGVPNNNITLNDKKPYLKNLTRKVDLPYLLNIEDIQIQSKLFDYMMSMASRGKVNIYISPDSKGNKFKSYKDTEEAESISYGYYLRVRKGMELEILQWDILPKYNNNLEGKFLLKNITNAPVGEIYEKEYKTLWQLKGLIDYLFFDGNLSNNFFTDARNIKIQDNVVKQSILKSRDLLFNWIRKGRSEGIEKMLNKISYDLILNSIYYDNIATAKIQYNLRYSLNNYFNNNENYTESKLQDIRQTLLIHLSRKDSKWIYDSLEEFSYATGQAISFINIMITRYDNFLRPSNDFQLLFNAKNVSSLKKCLINIFKRYGYIFDKNYTKIFNKLFTRIMTYGDNYIDSEIMMFGFLDDSICFIK